MRFFIGKAWDAGNGHSLAKSHNAVLWETSSSPQGSHREGNLSINLTLSVASIGAFISLE
jgi:hypothetical protein